MTRRRSIMDKAGDICDRVTDLSIFARVDANVCRESIRFPDRFRFEGSAATRTRRPMPPPVGEGNCRDPILMDNGIIGYGRSSPWG